MNADGNQHVRRQRDVGSGVPENRGIGHFEYASDHAGIGLYGLYDVRQRNAVILAELDDP